MALSVALRISDELAPLPYFSFLFFCFGADSLEIQLDSLMRHALENDTGLKAVRSHLVGEWGGSSHLAVVWRLPQVTLAAVADRLVEATTWIVWRLAVRRLVVRRLVVRGLVEASGLLFWGAPWVSSGTTLVPASLLKDEPDVACPQHKVQVAKDLWQRVRCLNRNGMSMDKNLFMKYMYSVLKL